MRFFIFTLCFVLTSAMGATYANTFSQQERQEVQTLINQYLMDNPEVLADALSNMQAHFERKEDDRIKIALRDNRDALYHNANDASLGRSDAPIIIVEFFDYNCGYCKRAFDDLMRVVKENDDVRLVFKEFPILGEASRLAAGAALALDDKQNFIRYHTRLMNSRTALNRDIIERALKSLGVQPDKTIEAGKADAIQAHLDDSRTLATLLDIDGTPSFIINDEIYKGALSYEELADAITQARTKLN